jgi:hypothetical protein
LTIGLLLLALLGAGVASLLLRPTNNTDPCSGAQSQTIACEAPNTTTH